MEQFPEEDYGMGVLTPDILPPKGSDVSDGHAGPTGLPDGIVMGAYDENELGITFGGVGSSLDDLTGNVLQASGITDLSWLEVDEQDVSRLPKNTPSTVIPELEEAWGAHRGTPGIHFHANEDIGRARYRASLEREATVEVPTEHLAAIVRKAMRLSAANPSFPFSQVTDQLREHISTLPAEVHHHLASIKEPMGRVAAEHGLAGRIFVRAEAYPGYENGKWADQIRKCAAARYILVPKRRLTATIHHNGHCSITKKKVVSSVPWKRARKQYAGALKATGRTVSMEGNAREALKAAFASEGRTLEATHTNRPVHVAPVQRVDTKTATAALKKHKPTRKRVSKKARDEAVALRTAQLQVAGWVKKGLLSKKDGSKLVKAGLNAETLVRAATNRIKATQSPEAYSGLYNEGATGGVPQVSVTQARKEMSASAAAQKTAQERLSAMVGTRVKGKTREAKKLRAVSERVAKIAKAIDRGVRGASLRHLIKTTIRRDEVHLASQFLDPILRDTNALTERKSSKTAEFSGPVLKHHTPMQRKAALTPSDREIGGLLRWARMKLSEGLCGNEFDSLLGLRFGPALRQASAQALQSVRDQHEGLSGHLYVDASAYASKKGTTGCEQGALLHRANGVRFVLAMDRCKGCAFANKRANGRAVCQKYNKDIVASGDVPEKHASEYQRRMIREANMSDSEATANIFAASYDPSEFDLSNGALDGIDITAAPTEQLSGIWFENDTTLDLGPSLLGD
jgi:hypothetical protein